MRTKEEIFAFEGIQDIDETKFPYQIKNAMDEYAKEVAIDFSKWVINRFIPIKTDLFLPSIITESKPKEYNTEQLYELYLQSKQK